MRLEESSTHLLDELAAEYSTNLTSKEDRKSASKFILEKGFAKDLPGHSLVLTPQGNELLSVLNSIQETDNAHREKKLDEKRDTSGNKAA